MEGAAAVEAAQVAAAAIKRIRSFKIVLTLVIVLFFYEWHRDMERLKKGKKRENK